MITVFVGPTLSAAEAAETLDAVYAPPAVQGDIYRAVRDGAQAIGLIDGHFESVPSVWHKEILWALSAGVPVFGSASMGALRAAELWQFGMVGIGEVFEAYRDGVLQDDDEVALSHLLADRGYRHVSEPLVDIRATIRRAVREEVIDDATGDALVAAAKALFYPDRDYPAIIAGARERAGADRLAAFATWWPAHRVSVKRDDALRMLRAMRDLSKDGVAHPQPDFWFERTALWDDLAREAADWDGRSQSSAGSASARALESDQAGTRATRDLALVRILARDFARHNDFQLDEDRLAEAIGRFREERALWEADDLTGWMERNHVDRAGFMRLIADEARLDWVRGVLARAVDAAVVDQLRSSGDYLAVRPD